MDVILVRWPAERARRDDLRRAGTPRLLLVKDGAPPPPTDDCLEDWVRLPTSEADVEARTAGLQARATRHGGLTPTLDEEGVLRNGARWAALPPVEARLTGVLLERQGAVVTREALARAGWSQGAPGRNALDVHVLRLRRRLAPLGLAIRTIRSRGYLLEPESGPEPT